VTTIGATPPHTATGSRLLFQAHATETTTHGIAGLHAEDMDGDGDPDLLDTALSEDAITLWRND
jgi:hypothetical protein